MKNTKEISFDIVRGNGRERSTAVNMRLRGGVLEAVGLPWEVAVKETGDAFLGVDRRGGRTYFFVQRPSGEVVIAGYNDGDEFTATDAVLFTTDGSVTSVAPCGQFVLFATADGLRYVRYDGARYVYLGGRPGVPEMQTGMTAGGTLSSEIAETTLKSTYTNWQGALSATDSRTLKSLMSGAIDDIRGQASTAGLCLEPVLLRVAVRLWDDTLLWSECPTIVGDLWKPEALTEVSDGGERTVSGVRLQAEAWMPTLRVVKADFGRWAPLVKAVEVYASADEMTYPSLFFRPESKKGTTECYLRMMAGNLNETALLQGKVVSERLRRIAVITDIESLSAGRLVADNLTATGDGMYAIRISNDGETATVQENLSPDCPSLLSGVGTDVFAAHMHISLPAAPSLMTLADGAAWRESTATTVTAVESATEAGTGRRVTSVLSDGYSLRLNKLVTCPDSRARRLTAIVVAEGARYRCDISLLPSADGRMAYAVNADGFELKADTGSEMPESADIVISDETTLVRCRGGNPLVWERCTAADNPGIVAVTPTFRYGSSWTLGRSPVCLFATDGVRLLSFSTAGRCTASTRISRRTVSDRRLVSATSDGLAFVDTHGEVCRFRNSKITPTGIKFGDALRTAYSAAYDELLVVRADGVVVVTEDDGYYYRTELLGETCGAYAEKDGTSIVDFDRERAGAVDVEARTGQNRLTGRLRSVVWDIDASDDCELRVEVTGENGHSCHGAGVSALTLRGVPTVPVWHRVASPRMRTFRLTVSGMMPSGTRLLPATVWYG